jgi:primase-polymerase (primpol)-like protein
LSRRRALPAALTDRPRWVRRTSTKRPVTVAGKPASSTDPSTWSTFREAKASSAGVGLGFVLGDGIGCLDLDHCFDGGVLADWAADYIRTISEPVIFAEVSQSGDGVHVFIEAPEGPGRKIRDGRNIERYTAGRYIAVTGNKLTL